MEKGSGKSASIHCELIHAQFVAIHVFPRNDHRTPS